MVREIWFEKSGSENLDFFLIQEKWLTRKKSEFEEPLFYTFLEKYFRLNGCLLVFICAFLIWMGYFKIPTKMVSTHNWSPQNVSAYYHYCNNTKRGTAKRRTPQSLLSKKLLHNSPFYMVKSCFLKNTKAMKSSPLLGPFCDSEFWGFSLLKI